MHLATNTQKAVFKLVLHWASSMEKGTEVKEKVSNLWLSQLQNCAFPRYLAACSEMKSLEDLLPKTTMDLPCFLPGFFDVFWTKSLPALLLLS
jgi:hypothetical protein